MTNIELHSNIPRLLDSEAKAIWFNEIYQNVASGRIDSKVGVASVNHAESVGYILPSDRTEFVSKLYPFAKKSISAGYIVLLGDESNYDSIRKMMGFAVLCSPASVPKYNEFMKLLDDPPSAEETSAVSSSSSRTATSAEETSAVSSSSSRTARDDLTLPMLRWDVEVWIAGIVSSLYNLELGWKDGHLVVDIGGFDE